MSIRNLVVGFSLLVVAAQAATAGGIYECDFNVDNTQFTCSSYNAGTPPVVEPPAPLPPPVNLSGFITPNIFVAEPSSEDMKLSYVPGCLNGLFAKDSSSGCATSLRDPSGKFSFGTGKQLYIKYVTPSTITNGKTIKVTGWNGSNVEVFMKLWITKDPYSSYADASQFCKTVSNQVPIITTGNETTVTTTKIVWGTPSTVTNWYCKLEPDTTYYLGIDFNIVDSLRNVILRFQVDQSFSDLR